MHSEDTATGLRTPSCHFCLQQESRRTIEGSCLRMEPTVAPFPKELWIDGAHTTGVYPPKQVYTEELRHPCHSRWDPPCVREIQRECGCIQRWYYPEIAYPYNGDHVWRVRGQHYYGHLSEFQQCTRRRVSFRHPQEERPALIRQSLSSPGKLHCNGTTSEQAFFPTEVPSSKLIRSGPQRDVKKTVHGDSKSLEGRGNQRKSQGTVREQIKQVVNELEEVLGGLKQVQLEMKEVVQQIDVLTSNIDLSEEQPTPSNGLPQDAMRSSQTDVVALIHHSNGDENDTSTSSSSLTHSPSDLLHINSPSPMRNHSNSSPTKQHDINIEDKSSKHSSETQRTHRTANGNCVAHRIAKKVQLETHKPPIVPVVCTNNSNKTHRPPPYPQNGQVKMRTPPYPGKHKTLSSTVVD